MIYEIGQKASFSKTITDQDVDCFAKLCGDFNPLHMDQKTAEKSVYGKRVVHGALVAATISTALGMYLPGEGTIYLKQTTSFTSPVFVGDTVTAEVVILSIDEKKRATLSTIVKNQKDERVIVGEAVVMLPVIGK